MSRSMKTIHEIIYKIMIILCISFVIEEIIMDGAEGKKIKYGIGNHENISKELSLKSYFMKDSRIYKNRHAMNLSTSNLNI